MMDTGKGSFSDQVAGKRVVSIGGKLTPTGAEIIGERNDKQTEELTRGLISILCGNDDDERRVEDNHTV